MSNDYFNAPDALDPNTTARSGDINSRINSIASGFDLLPDEAQIKSGIITYGVDTGSINQYEITLPFPPTVYTEGMVVEFKVTTANSGASTLNVFNPTPLLIGVKSIKRADGSALVSGDLVVDTIAVCIFDGVNFQLVSSSVGDVAAAAASAAAAAVSAAAALVSENNADTSETNAAASAAAAAADLATIQANGLTDLTSGEVDQLKNINSVTISNPQWVGVGSMSTFGASLIADATASAARDTLGLGLTDSPTFDGLFISSTNPALRLLDQNGGSGFEEIFINTDSSQFSIQTRTAADVFVAEMYTIPFDGSGPTSHRRFVAGTLAEVLDVDGLNLLSGILSVADGVNINDASIGYTFSARNITGVSVANFEGDGAAAGSITISNIGTSGGAFRLVSGETGVSNVGFSIYDEDAAATRLTIDGSGNINVPENLSTDGSMAVSGTTAVMISGTGSPEGVETAIRGSKFTRTDGGAGTSSYTKESGTGNTGWAGK